MEDAPDRLFDRDRAHRRRLTGARPALPLTPVRRRRPAPPSGLRRATARPYGWAKVRTDSRNRSASKISS